MIWVIFVLILIILGVFGLLWVIKFIQSLIANRATGMGLKGLKIVDVQFLDPKTRVVAIDYIDSRYLILVGQNQATLIDKMSAPIDVKKEVQ
jgi:flagellar biogenesis protein FliO